VVGQKGTVKMSGCNRLRSAFAVDATGPVWRDSGEQSAGALLAPARGRTERNMEKDAKDVPRLAAFWP
jgi:hypothetical protein